MVSERKEAVMGVSPEAVNCGMEWLCMAVVELVQGDTARWRSSGSPLRQEGGYHKGERVVRKLRKATRSETTRAKQ